MSRFRKFWNRGWGYLWRRYTPFEAFLPEIDQADLQLMREVRPFTMTSPERMYALLTAVRYIASNRIQGDIVECGVWRGGSMMLIAKALLGSEGPRRRLFLYDTFAGMTKPSPRDRTQFEQRTPEESYASSRKEGEVVHWSYASIEEVQRNLSMTGYDHSKLHFVKGPVEQTIPGTIPDQIALLRLDTDFYESSKHEMLHLFPRLVSGGVLILDDFGHWEGQRLAVEEYIQQHNLKLLLNRIDYSGRIAVKL